MDPAISKKPLLSDLVAQQIGKVPSTHIRPVGDRPDLAHVDNESGAGIPLIDLEMLNANRPDERRKVVEAIGRACESDGFFMVTNHGIPPAVVEGMLRVAREFFHLPESERLKCYSDDPKKAIRLSTSFNVRTEKVNNWRDFLRLHCYPLENFVDQWPSNPQSFRQVVGTYATEARALALRLLEAISESLGLERSHMVAAMGHAQHMAVNYYPPCPQPELTYGLPGHKDPNAITVLLQDGVSGLQVQRGGRWVAVNPVPDALVINIGDQMQALSNDRYKSVLHRVIVNSESERNILVRTFLCPSPDALVDDDCLDLFMPGGSMDLNKLNRPERKLTRNTKRMFSTWLPKSCGSKAPLLPVAAPSQRQPAQRESHSSSPPLDTSSTGDNAAPATASGQSSASSSQSRDTTATRAPFSITGKNAALAATTTDPKSGFLYAIYAITFALLGSIKVKDISSSWQTWCRALYGIFIMLSVLSTVTSIYIAISRSGRLTRTSSIFAWLGLLMATALFAINIFFQLL